MKKNPLLELERFHQSPWLDFISRSLLDRGEFESMVLKDGIKGITSNPTIFQKSISETGDYDADIFSLYKKFGSDFQKIYEHLAIDDLRRAADILYPVYAKTKFADGYVSLEISPHLAHDTKKSVEEGVRLWHELDRKNAMIKIPGTAQGIKAIEELVAFGINVNVTLLFSVEMYELAALAYLQGLDRRIEAFLPIDSMCSVASFFISRIDTKLDQALNEIIDSTSDEYKKRSAKFLLGKIAIANAKAAYKSFKKLDQEQLSKRLKEKGAHPQKLLWASTGTKNKTYSDVLYVEQLIGCDTINTMPLETFMHFKDHGQVANTLDQNCDQALLEIKTLSSLGIDLKKICNDLTREGIDMFINSYDALLKVLKERAL